MGFLKNKIFIITMTIISHVQLSMGFLARSVQQKVPALTSKASATLTKIPAITPVQWNQIRQFSSMPVSTIKSVPVTSVVPIIPESHQQNKKWWQNRKLIYTTAGLIVVGFMDKAYYYFIVSEPSLVQNNTKSKNYSFLIRDFSEKKDRARIEYLFEDSSDISLQTGISTKYDNFPDFFLLEEYYKVFICEDLSNNKIIGFLIVQTSEEDRKSHNNTLYVKALGVNGNYRRLGIANQLLEFAEYFAKQNAYRGLSLSVLERNYGAIQLYEKSGFINKPGPYANNIWVKEF